MRLWVSGGGTAGHVYPALAVAEAGGADMVGTLWLGSAAGMEAGIVSRQGWRYRALDGGPIHGVSAPRLAANALRIVHGTYEAWRLMARERPDALLVTGGYASVPAALAGRLRRVPLLVFLPDVVPGKAVRLLSALADRVATTSERSLPYLPKGRAVDTGYPVRQAVRSAERAPSRRLLGIAPSARVLLAFGGSRGAQRINRAVTGAAAAVLDRVDILHVTGRLDHDAVLAARDALPAGTRQRYRVFPFLDSDAMSAALAASDLVLSRSGAAVMGEYPARGLPSILVPLPIAGGHQSANAAVLADAGAAVLIADAELDADRLRGVLCELLDDPRRLATMARAAATLDRPDAATRIWGMLAELATRSRTHAGNHP